MITAKQRQLRSQGIGSSDAPAILGMDPFRNAFAVWADKTGRDPGFDGNEATRRGNHLEAGVLNWAQEQLGGITLKRNVFIKHPDRPLLVNLDACFGDAPEGFIVEAKTTNDPDEWGDEDTDEVPERVLVQTHHAMLVSGYRRAYVPVLLPAFKRLEFRMYRIERNDDLAQAIGDRCEEFWNEHIIADVAPPESMPAMDVLKRLRRTPNKSVAVDDALVDALIVAKAAAKQAAEDEERAMAKLVLALGDAEAGEYSGGVVTYMQSRRKGYTVEPATYRQLRIKEKK
ncbi:MAG TPA: YqaJ viral recombinase family protein [Tepidisphaeraceae bacterium]|nr:YqaJ viral recombinase family protein [Tepidisphaeraceae bacterium]